MQFVLLPLEALNIFCSLHIFFLIFKKPSYQAWYYVPEAGGSGSRGHPGLHNVTLSQERKKEKEKRKNRNSRQ
jgi:hypothetical protein